MKFTIITSSLNDLVGLKKTIDSIIIQDEIDWEHIIIDGNSNDGTIQYFGKLKNPKIVFVSEQDTGVYNAWNKAINKINGDWVIFLGAGDTLFPSTLNKFRLQIESDSRLNFICSKTLLYEKQNIIIGEPFDEIKIEKYCNISISGACIKSTFFQNFSFDEKFNSAGDYDFILSIRKQINPSFIDEVLSTMQPGGISSKLISLIETRKAQINRNVSSLTLVNLYFIKSYFAWLKNKLIFKF